MANDPPQMSPQRFCRTGDLRAVRVKGREGARGDVARRRVVDPLPPRRGLLYAPQGFTPDVPFSPPVAASGACPVPDAATLSDLAPINDGSKNGRWKVVSYIKRNRLRLRGASPVSPAAALSNAVERAVHAVEFREVDARESLLAYGGGVGSQIQSQAFDKAACHSGPFSRAELGQLALHYAAEVRVRCNGSAWRATSLGAWASLNGDLLATLASMLQRHVKSVLAIPGGGGAGGPLEVSEGFGEEEQADGDHDQSGRLRCSRCLCYSQFLSRLFLF